MEKLKSPKFWLALSLSIVALLVTLGVISPAQQAGLEGAIGKVIESVGSLMAAFVTIYRYGTENGGKNDPNSSGSEGG